MEPEFVPLSEPLRAPVHKKELVLFVGGYGSRANDGAFDDLAARFPADQYDVRRLGDDPRFPYDTYGGVDANAQILTDEVRSIGGDYTAVNIVSHCIDLPLEAIREQIRRGIDVVVHQERDPAGVRRVVEIAELSPERGDPYTLTRIYP